jgi:predicted amidophosphoribosyltransferase
MSKKIFYNDHLEQLSKEGQVVLCGYYHRYWNSDKTRNQAFDMFSGKILDVKERKERGISYFFHQLDREICKNVSICVVPSHVEGKTNNSGIADLVRRLANNGRIDKVDLLFRSKTIDKLAYGGSRDIKMQLDSIEVNQALSINGENVLIVDDVTTSGTSLEACKKILLNNGAERVAMLALGQSI